MRVDAYNTADQIWIRDQTARILHRHVLAGKHFRVDVDALLSRVGRLRTSMPADAGSSLNRRKGGLRMLRALSLSLAAFGLAVLPGCAAIQGRVAADSQEILAQAGFERELLDVPGLPSRQLVQIAGGYEFADPDFCRCVYVGGVAQYAELLKLRAATIAERDWIFSRTQLPPDRTLWSAWKPEGLDAISAERGAGYAFSAPVEVVR